MIIYYTIQPVDDNSSVLAYNPQTHNHYCVKKSSDSYDGRVLRFALAEQADTYITANLHAEEYCVGEVSCEIPLCPKCGHPLRLHDECDNVLTYECGNTQCKHEYVIAIDKQFGNIESFTLA